MGCIEIVGAGVITIILAVAVVEESGEELTPIEQAHRDYDPGRIDEQDLEHRVAFNLPEYTRQ